MVEANKHCGFKFSPWSFQQKDMLQNLLAWSSPGGDWWIVGNKKIVTTQSILYSTWSNLSSYTEPYGSVYENWTDLNRHHSKATLANHGFVRRFCILLYQSIKTKLSHLTVEKWILMLSDVNQQALVCLQLKHIHVSMKQSMELYYVTQSITVPRGVEVRVDCQDIQPPRTPETTHPLWNQTPLAFSAAEPGDFCA